MVILELPIEHNVATIYKRAIWLTRNKRIHGKLTDKKETINAMIITFNIILRADRRIVESRDIIMKK